MEVPELSRMFWETISEISDLFVAFCDGIPSLNVIQHSKLRRKKVMTMPSKKDVVGTVIGATVGAALGFGVAHFVGGKETTECDGCCDVETTEETVE